MRLLVSARIAPYGADPQLAARHGQRVVERDADWFESFGPGAWLLGGAGAQVQDGHGGTAVGSVVVTAAHGKWWTADCVIESNDPQVLERIRIGQPVSVGFDDIASDDNHRSHVRQHRLARLKHVAVLKRGQVPAYVGAEITSVVEAKAKRSNLPKLGRSTVTATATKSSVDWRTELPSGYEAFRDMTGDLEIGTELLKGQNRRGPRWDGQRFVVGAYARAA